MSSKACDIISILATTFTGLGAAAPAAAAVVAAGPAVPPLTRLSPCSNPPAGQPSPLAPAPAAAVVPAVAAGQQQQEEAWREPQTAAGPHSARRVRHWAACCREEVAAARLGSPWGPVAAAAAAGARAGVARAAAVAAVGGAAERLRPARRSVAGGKSGMHRSTLTHGDWKCGLCSVCRTLSAKRGGGL